MPRVLVSVAIALCLLAPACGGDSEPDHFSSGYNAAIERLDQASQQVIALAPARKTRSPAGRSPGSSIASRTCSPARAASWRRWSRPTRATKQFDQLVAALDESVTAGHQAADAAREIQPARQRRALRELRDAALEIAHAQDALGRAVNSTS